jgi:hypothetical protein
VYHIIGSDQKEYGPISADQLKRWMAENRVNAQTRILAEGATEWKTVADCPELAEAVAGKSPPPVVGASGPKPDADALAAQILARDYRIEIGSCIARSWGLLTRHFWLIVGAAFVLGLIQGAVGLLAGVCMGSLYFLLLKLIRGERAEFGDAFAGFSLAFLPLFLAGLVSGLLTCAGLLLCLLPGIYLAVAWVFALPLVIDKKMDFWPAMELSRKVVHRHWWVFFGLLLVNVLICLLGLAACIIGVFIAQPVAYGALIYAYEDIFGTKPPPPREVAA